MDFKPLPEQTEIIESRDKNLIVSASAGSGKTTVMIERICKLIQEGKVSPKGLLVLTYTKSAASEMKQKLYNSLRKKSEDLKNYNQIMDEIAVADISTIHSFCSRLIKKYFHVLGVSPNFQVLDEGKAGKIKTELIKNCLTEFANNNFDEYMLIMKNFAPNRKYDNIVKIVLDINNYTKNYISRQEFLNSATYLYNNKNIAFDILNENIIQHKLDINKKIENLMQICSNLDIKKYIEYLNKMSEKLEKISKNNDFLTNFAVFYEFLMPTLIKDKNVDEQINDKMEQFKLYVKNIVSKYKLKNYGDKKLCEVAIDKNLNIINVLLKIEQKFYNNFDIYKQDQNLFDYSDLEELAIKICEIPQIRQELKQNYKYVFIDEYQDANEVQEKLLSMICNENNRFMVGDVKQSIYRFRGSKPEIFQQIEKHYENDDNSQAKRLSVNFRSDKQILNFVNFVFENIMTENTGGVDFKNKGKFEKTSNVNFDDTKVNILICEKKEELQKNVASGLYNLQNDQQNNTLTDSQKEGMIVGQQILNLLDKKIVENNVERNIKYSDITILVRKRGENYKQFCDTLIQLGIPVYASTSDKIFDNPESMRFVNLLKTCLSFKDDIALVSTMVSYFNFDESELSQIRLYNLESSYFYLCVLNQMKEDSILSKKINSFYQQMQYLINQINRIGCYKALSEFFAKIGYFELLKAKKDETRIEIVKSLLSQVRKDEYNFNISAFIEFVTKGGNIESPNLSKGDNDFVNITTIHSSKGLEYPVVFMVDSGSDFTKTAVETISFNEKLGMGLKYFDLKSNTTYNDVVCDAIKLVNKKEEFAEKLRVLYVALTRPKNLLFIVGTTKLQQISNISDDKEILQQKSFIDLILSSFGEDVLNKIKCCDKYLYTTENMKVSFSKIADCDFTGNQTKNILFGKGDKQLEELFLKTLNKNNISKTTVALKNSVSTLASENAYENVVYSAQNLTIEQHLRDGYDAEQGTNFHKILELIDYQDYKNNEKIKNLCDTYDIEKDKVVTALKILNDIFKGKDVKKENKFIMKVPYNLIVDSNITDEVMVQGIIDAFCVEDDRAVIVDFKLTKIKSEQKLINRYRKQLKLYEMAIKMAYDVKEVELYILSLDYGKIIKIN